MNRFLTTHGELRLAQRNLSLGDIEYVLAHGQKFHRAGALIFFLRKRDIPAWDLADASRARLAGTAVVATRDGRIIITAWRNLRRGLSRVKTKPCYSDRDALEDA